MQWIHLRRMEGDRSVQDKRADFLKELKGMDAKSILMAIAEAKGGSKDVYSSAIPGITRCDTMEWLDLFITLASQSAILSKAD